MPPKNILARDLSHYALELRYEDLPEDVVWQAKRMTLDTLGCAIAACEAEPVRIARKLALDVQGKRNTATLLGTHHRSTLDLATFVNVTMARYLDLNDYKPKPGGHPSDNILTCLTVSDFSRATGKDFLTSVVLAYEVQGAFGEATRFKDREWTWDYTNNVLIASAVVASKLMGLSVEMATEAVNIAVNAHISMLQVRSGEISLWKAGSSGEAAKSAVFSAMLAAEGMTGPSPIFEGEYGYFKQVMGVDSVKVCDFGRGGKYSISDTRIKLYPSNGSTQTGICAAVNARKSIENIVDIEKVEILTNARTYKGSGKGAEKWAPKTRETADHSLPYTVATALIDGTVSPSSYESEKLQNQQVATLMNKITVQEDAALTSMFPEKSATTLKIQLRSGKVIVETVEYPKGHPQHPVSDEEIEIKFRNLVGGYLKKSQIQSIIDFIWMLEKQPGLGQLFESCVTEKLP
jgi:2-methylcitrate dehydratase